MVERDASLPDGQAREGAVREVSKLCVIYLRPSEQKARPIARNGERIMQSNARDELAAFKGQSARDEMGLELAVDLDDLLDDLGLARRR